MKTLLFFGFGRISGLVPVLLLLLLPTCAFSQIEKGLYTVKLGSSGTTLDAHWPDMDTDGCRIQTWTYLGGANQHWKIQPSGMTGIYNILLAGSGRALDAAWNERFTNGGRIILWNFNNGESQRWRVEKITGDRYRITLAVSNKFLSGTGNVDGSRVRLWDNLHNTTQEWIIEKVTKITISDKYVDLRPNQTGIQNQGARGTCTTFASTAALEAAYKKAGYGNVNLSEEFFAMQGKALYIHPIWGDTERKGADSRENQLAGTQGGGSVFAFKNGFAIPDSSYVPYRPTNYPWDTITNPALQKSVNNFNFSLNTDSVLKAPRYYGANSVQRLLNPRNAAEYEQLLRQGYEIHFSVRFVGSDAHPDNIWRPACDPDTDENCNPGGHNMLIVGYDKTDPDPENHYFIVKNSWGHSRIPGSDGFNYMHYDYLKYTYDAEYIVNVNPPKKWPELSLLGEYSLNFDGWKGRLDIYHLPGLAQYVFEGNGVSVTDRRLGIFYDQSGKAFRVNGYIRRVNNELLQVTFFLNVARPNPRWDELSGRKFVYYYDYNNDFMAGFHTDPGSKFPYAGYAIKAKNTFIANPVRTSRPFNAASYKNSSWNVDISSGPKGKLYISQSGSNLSGNFFNNATRSVSDVQITTPGSDFSQMEIRFNTFVLKGKHLSWEKGLISGYDVNSKKPFHMVRQRPQVPDLIWTRVGSPISGQAVDVCACGNGSLYALRNDKRLYQSTTGGEDSSWRYIRTLPPNTRQITCARNYVYYQVVNTTGGGNLWYIDGPTSYRMAALAEGGVLAGSEDNTLDFPFLYLLNTSKELFRSSTSGANWTKVDRHHSAKKIAATQNALYALNGRGTFWVNRYGGADPDWVQIDQLTQAIDITATSIGQTGKADLYYLHQDRSLWRTSVFEDTLGHNARTTLATLPPELILHDAESVDAELPVTSELSETLFIISPNPTSDIVKLSYRGQVDKKLFLQMHDLNGRLILQFEAKGSIEEEVDVYGLPKGIYMVSILGTEGKVSKKLLVR